MSAEYDDLAKRVAALEGELAEAKKALEAVKPPEPYRPRMTMPKIDYTEGMSMSGSAMKPMVDLVNPQGLKFDPSAWARNRLSEPGGFGPPPGGNWDKGPTKVRPEEKLKIPEPPRSYWSNPNK
jgi:hypothetical protein